MPKHTHRGKLNNARTAQQREWYMHIAHGVGVSENVSRSIFEWGDGGAWDRKPLFQHHAGFL